MVPNVFALNTITILSNLLFLQSEQGKELDTLGGVYVDDLRPPRYSYDGNIIYFIIEWNGLNYNYFQITIRQCFSLFVYIVSVSNDIVWALELSI